MRFPAWPSEAASDAVTTRTGSSSSGHQELQQNCLHVHGEGSNQAQALLLDGGKGQP